MDGTIFRFVELIIILAIYENSGPDGIPSQIDLIGKPPKWDGYVNQLMYEVYLIDDTGKTNDLAYGSMLKSGNTFSRAVSKMREAGIMIESENLRTSFALTALGKQIGAYLSEFAHYSDMPKAALVHDGEVTYGD